MGDWTIELLFFPRDILQTIDFGPPGEKETPVMRTSPALFLAIGSVIGALGAFVLALVGLTPAGWSVLAILLGAVRVDVCAHGVLTGHDAWRWSALGSGLFVPALAGRTRMHAAANYIARSNGNAGRRPRALSRIGWLPARLWGAPRSGARRFVCGKAVAKVEAQDRAGDTLPLQFSLARALVAGGLAGVVGGWAFGQWMAKAHFFPLIAGLVGSSSPGLGKTLHFVIAVIIGATFGLLFQRDVRGYGSSLGWGLAYGIFWWFLGPRPSSRYWSGTCQTGRSREDKSCSAHSWVISFTA